MAIAFNKQIEREVRNFEPEEEEVERWSCARKFAPYVIDPLHRYKLAWDTAIGCLYFVAFFLDAYILAFVFTPLIGGSAARDFTVSLAAVFLFDSLLKPLTGVAKKGLISSGDDDEDDHITIANSKNAKDRRGSVENLQKH